MSDSLFVEERRQRILDQLERSGRVAVKDLSEQLGVSTVTIRQDLRVLEELGLLDRTYGGAIRREEGRSVELSFHVRQRRQVAEKEAIARAAFATIREGWSIALDGSTSCYALVKHLKTLNQLTVVTNSLMIAQSFLDSPQIQVLIAGGRLRRDSISTVDNPNSLPSINLNVGFFGAHGITWANGITEVGADEVAVKQAMIARCVATIILADGSKWGEVAPYTYAHPLQVSAIITDSSAPPALVDHFRAQGVNVQVVRLQDS